MKSKSSALAFPSYSCLQPFCTPQSSASCRRTRHHPRQCHSPSLRRLYAQHHDSRTSSSSQESSGIDDHLWPTPSSPALTPTPYQILKQERNQTYCKNRFHRLVKVYHPDRTKHLPSSHPCASLPPHVLLERYRLIIAAHALLSNDARRSAYDRFGAGWVGAGTAGAAGSAKESAWYYNFDRGMHEKPKWKPGVDPMANATWEDWEKWHSRTNPDREDQKPMYASNGTFMTFILAFVVAGVAMQANRSETFQESLIEQRDRAHANAHIDLRRSRQAGQATATQEESIRHFLRTRDESTWEDEAY